ncbi:ecdysteroid 22-kinase family protein [Skermania piniformis]|uniref:Ecdysteroid 22-kinase family protein n=1 Tax=Skermania pinensis TaxID=39122 RepID=A0ABX8SHH8_9ACTN|nr:ecdysteroid 22-kinase family protein [Skermania piniformis]
MADRAVGGRASIPLRIDRLTPTRLADVLGLSPKAIRSLRILDADSGTAARARIAVDSDADLPKSLFVKLPPHDFGQQVLLNLFRLGAREVLVYRALGAAAPVRVPRCYAARHDPVRKRSLLILEDLSGRAEFRTCVDTVTRAEAEAVVDALADLHARFWATDRFVGDLRPLAARSAAEIAVGDLIRRYLLGRLTGPIADLVPPETKRACRMFFERSADIDRFWAAQPQTLTHGDPHLGNLFVEAGVPGFLDWQVASAGVGIRDVAYFATASVEPGLLRRIERDLVRRYAARLERAGIAVAGDRLWTLYVAALTEPLLAFVCTAAAGDRMQPFAVSQVGVERAVAAVTAYDSFAVLAELIGPDSAR